MGLTSAFFRDNGTRDEPGLDSAWEDWVAASKTYNFCCGDTLVDWLQLHGRNQGFVSDLDRGGFDDRTDFRTFIFERGARFERAVYDYLGSRHQLSTIRTDPAEIRSRAAVEATWNAMTRGDEIIAQGVLWNPENKTYGSPDLLVRSDVLHRLFPIDLSEASASVPATDLPVCPWHYRVVDIKFTTLDLLKDGHAGGAHLSYMVQLWLYNEALGRMQGFTPPAAFLLGRRWKASNDRGHAALDRLARIDRQRDLKTESTDLRSYALAACEWIRRVRSVGATWQVLPVPSVEELWPNLREKNDQWHFAKQQIGEQLQDLTTLPRVTPDKRTAAISAGLARWTDPGCCAASLGITGNSYPAIVDAVIQANQSSPSGPIVFPSRISANESLWRVPVIPEFYVDFETVSDLDDDFSRFPEPNGEPMIFMIGCGRLTGPPSDAKWEFNIFTADSLCPAEERRIIEAWLVHMQKACAEAGTDLAATRFFHWSPAETSFMTEAYNAAYIRHGEPPWPNLPWCDLLNRVVKTEPVTVRGAFGFGLKAIAKAMHDHGLIQTVWGDGSTDGLGAMVGAWWCNREAKSQSVPMSQLELMKEIAAYNEVDCRVMAEILEYFRRQR